MPLTDQMLDEVAGSMGQKVRRLRERRNWTQEELAHKVGMSRNQIQNIERSRNNSRDPLTGRLGRGNPRLDTIYLLADVLGVKAAVLIDPELELPE
jgi:transcriptional regulator with XRE-family HTH domain